MKQKTTVLTMMVGALLITEDALAGFEQQELELPGMTLWVATGDLDGDGLTDLIASYRRGSGPAAQRFLAIFFRRPQGYTRRPDVAFAAPRNAAIFDVGDAFGDAQDELLYLTPSGVFAQGFVKRKPGAPTRIVATQTLVGEPEEEDFPYWDFVRDVPKLGKTMLLPTRGKLHIYKREEGASLWKRHSSIDLRQYSYYDVESANYRRSPRGGSSGRPYSMRVTTIVPNVDFVEQTGDGKVDVVTNFDDRLEVYPQLEDGTFSTKPVHRQWMQVLTKEELENRDTGVSAQVEDLDGDGIADLALTKIGGGITTLASEVRLHRGRKGGGFEEKPAQVFADEGFAALARFVDVDGDGKKEMVHPHAEVSIMSISSAMLSSELGLDIRIRRGSGGDSEIFDRKPAQKLETSFGLDLSVGAALRGAAPIFGHDFDGDGIRDVILSEGGDKMLLHRGKRGKEPFEEDGHVALAAEGSNTTLVIQPSTKKPGKPDVLVYYVARRGKSGKLVLFKNTF